MRKFALSSLAVALLAVGFMPIAEAAIYHITLSAGGRLTTAPGVWLKVDATLYRDRKVARAKYKFKNRYQWYAFKAKEWDVFAKKGRVGNPPVVQGSWLHTGRSKLRTDNAWKCGVPGDYALVCQTSKTNWNGAGVLKIRVAVPKAAPRPRRPMRKVTKILVKPETATLRPGQRLDFVATAMDQWGKPMNVTLDTACTGGGSVTGCAFIAGRKPGKYQIWVRHAGTNVARIIEVTVVQPRVVTKITVNRAKVVVRPGQKVTVIASALDQFDQIMNVPLEYSTTGGGVMHGNTYVAGQAEGDYQIWVRHKGSNIASVVTVVILQPRVLTHLTVTNPIQRARPGDHVVVEVMGWDQKNRKMAASGLTWTCNGRAFKGGSFTAPRRSGHYRIVVTHSSGVSAWADVYVTNGGNGGRGRGRGRR